MRDTFERHLEELKASRPPLLVEELLHEYGDDFVTGYVASGGQGATDLARFARDFRSIFLGHFKDMRGLGAVLVQREEERLPAWAWGYFEAKEYARHRVLLGDVWTCEAGDGEILAFLDD